MDVFVSKIGVPKKFRNGRIYGGNSFNTTNQYEQSEQLTATRHFETGRIKYETLDPRTITIPFEESFDNIPTISELKVYRMVLKYGIWIVQDVLHHFDSEEWYTLDGFTVVIDDSEDMEDVILNYNFTE